MQADKCTFVGPGNVHARRAVLRASIMDAAGVTVEPQAILRLKRALETLRGGLLDLPAWRRLSRSKEPWPAAAVVEVLAVIAQRYTCWPVMFCDYRPPATDAAVQRPQREGVAIFETVDERIGQAAADFGVTIVASMLNGAGRSRLGRDLLAALKKFLDATLLWTPSADVLHVARLARDRDIPWHVFGQSPYVRIGLGRHAEILKGTESTRTSSIGRAMSRDKSVTNMLLSEAGLPVASQRTARTERRALAVAKDLGYPLVVKPIDGNMGRDVTIGVETDGQMRQAFARAVRHSERVVIEQLIPGDETRLLVVNGKLQSAVRRVPAQVVGDGMHSVAELVDIENARPEREALLEGKMAVLGVIQLDADAVALLDQQGLTPKTVPAEGHKVLLRRESNISRGGSALDMTDQVHPSVRRVAEQAARALRLDVCGVDFITPDISRHWQETGGAICEVNSRPGINSQLYFMSETRRRKILSEIFTALVGADHKGRMPVVALIGTPAVTTALCSAVEAQAQREGRVLGIVGGTARPGRSSIPMSRTDELFGASEIDAAVVISEAGALLERGLGLSRIDAAVFQAEDEAQIAPLSSLLEQVAPGTVLPATDPEALRHALAGLGLSSEGTERIWAVVPQPGETVIPMQRAKGTSYTALFLGDMGFGESYLHHPRMTELQQILSVHGHEYSLRALRPLLGSADHVIGNLEVPLAARPSQSLQGQKKYLGWCDPARTVQALQAVGINAVSLANNHAMDCGAQGLEETFRHLDAAGIKHFGAGATDRDALMPHIHSFTVGRTRRTLVVFGGFEYRRRYATRYRWYAGASTGGVGMLSPDKIAEWIQTHGQKLRNPTFVAYPHWGKDYEEVTADQRRNAQQLVDAGIDMVIGHGAHVSQAVEVLGGKTVVYNIGNFVWNTPGRFNRIKVPPVGTAAALRFSRTLKTPMTLDLYPLMIDNDVTRFQNRLVTETEAAPAREVLGQRLPSCPEMSYDNIGYYMRLAV